MKNHSLKCRIAVLEAVNRECDRRYMEVAAEREKAIKIKEAGDEKALNLARDIQVYKDEKANELRSQIEKERGSYATHTELLALSDKLDVTLKPIVMYVAAQNSVTPRAITTHMLVSWAGTIVLILAFWFAYGNKMINSSAIPTPVTITQPIK